MDFCRLEAGLHVKANRRALTQAAGDRNAQVHLMRYVEWLDPDDGTFLSPTPLGGGSLPAPLRNVGGAVLAIRKAFSGVSGPNLD
jgi:hypothetical protein